MVNLRCVTNETSHGELFTITLSKAYTELAPKEGPYEWTTMI